MTLPDTAQEIDTSQGIRVNFSDQEASSESRTLLPAGKYRVRITDVETRYSQSDKNKGKPYYSVEFTIQDGQYAGRKVWTNAMLFEGALYTITQLLKALGQNVTSGEFLIPGPDFFQSKELDIRVTIKKDKDGQYDDSNDVKGFFAIKEGSEAPSAAGNLLP